MEYKREYSICKSYKIRLKLFKKKKKINLRILKKKFNIIQY